MIFIPEIMDHTVQVGAAFQKIMDRAVLVQPVISIEQASLLL